MSESTTTGEYTGGFSGRSIGMTYDQCYTLAEVSTQTADHAGGFIGMSYIPNPGLETGLMQNCYAIGSVTGSGSLYGGLVGESRLPIQNSYSAGETISGINTIGGVAGSCSQTSSIIRASMALGNNVSAQGNLAGRIAASKNTAAVFQNNYAIDTMVLIKNNVPVAPIVNPSGLDGGTVTLAGLPGLLTTIGWDTSTIWDVTTIPTLGRLTLRQNPE